MAERLTTNQEVPGSTPGWIVFLLLFSHVHFLPPLSLLKTHNSSVSRAWLGLEIQAGQQGPQ